MNRATLIACLALLLTTESALPAQDISTDRDSARHSVRFVVVDQNVKLEVLDWGGSGRPMILLHAANRTAHDFDDFAPKLTGSYHVYGITRRGSGASSSPPPLDANYSADRLGNDVLAVIEELGLDHPVLVGHSLGGQELSSVGSRHPEKIAGLIYLEAGYQYAYYDPSKGFLDIEVNEVRRKLEQLEAGRRPPDPTPLIDELLETNIPELERSLRQIRDRFKNEGPKPQDPVQARPPVPPLVAAMTRGSQRYTVIRAPALAVYAFEAAQGPQARRPDSSPKREIG